MKTILLKIAKTFPKKHIREGQSTFFREKTLDGEKIHTIRGNYDYWKEKIDMVNAGEAILCLVQWSGISYRSKVEAPFKVFDKNSGIGVQMIEMHKILNPNVDYCNGYSMFISKDIISKNDGLSVVDFDSWFRKYDLSEPMALIHFTGFRY